VNLLDDAGVTWRAYVEGIPGGTCPLANSGHFVPRHVPFLMYQDVTGGNDPTAARCIEHVVPFAQLADDLAAGTTAAYDFITPDLCDDMHGASGCPTDHVLSGDTWLANVVPMIEASSVYQDGHAAILITFDESEHGEYPIGMIAISPHARAGYASTVPYTHSSTLRTLEEVFAVHPLLGDAANASSLSDLFSEYP
jgi:phospholipase C